MGNPYLNKDESIILATHKVMVKSISSDVLLTNQRLIIVESGHSSFLPHAIPLAVIETVSRRENANGDPEISLSITPPTRDDAPIMVTLSFPPVAGEVRLTEIENWMTKLRQMSAAAREIVLQTGEKPVYPEQENGQGPGPSVQPVAGMDTIRIAPRQRSLRQRIGMGTKPIEGPGKLSIRPSQPAEPVAASPSPVLPVSGEPEFPAVHDEEISPPPSEPAAASPSPVLPVSDEPEFSAVHAEEMPLPPTGTPPVPSAGVSERQVTFAVAAVIVLMILAVTTAIIIFPGLNPGKSLVTTIPLVTTVTTAVPQTVTTVATPVLTTQQVTPVITPSPQFSIPRTGVWVRVSAVGNFTGSLGPAGRMRTVSGSGIQFYQIPARNETVEISIQKQDGSKNPLSIDVYNDGIPAGNATISTPNGAIDLHVNLK